jgi:serine/threonine protein phosphatase 1
LDVNSACIPPGVRLYAIGDIHGRVDLLRKLLEIIVTHEVARPSQKAALIFLGDYVDRGPDSRGVIDLLIDGLPENFQTIFLRGNHEDMMLRAIADPDLFDFWAGNGGLATIQSYGINIGTAQHHSPDEARALLAELDRVLPQSHRDFLVSLRLWAKVGDYFFVHAGVRPGVPLRQQAENDCLFIRNEFLRDESSYGKIIVHGHTPVREPEIRPNRIGIDTGAVFTGRLTALVLEGRIKSFLTTNSASD